MRTRVLIRLAAVLAAIGSLYAEDPWRYIDPASKMVMGIQWRRIAESPLGQKMRQDMNDQMPAGMLPGASFLKSVDHILIASTALPSKKASKDAPPPAVIVVSGQFDLAKVRAAINKKSRRAVVQNIEVFETSDKTADSNMGIALVSSEILVLGDFPSVVRALGAPSSSGRESDVIARARQLSERNEFWILSSVAPATVTGPNVPIPVPLPLDEVEGLEMGLSLAKGAGLEMALEMSSPEAAVRMKDQLQKTLKLAGKEKQRPELANFDKYLKVSVDKEFLRLSLQMDQAAVDQRLKAWQSHRKQQTVAQSAQPAPAAVPAMATAPPVAAKPAKPVIWNADPPQD